MEKSIENDIRDIIQSELTHRIGDLGSENEEDIKDLTHIIVRQTVDDFRERGSLITEEEEKKLSTDFINDFLYLGPLQPLFDDPTISEIMVNGGGFDEDGKMRRHEVWIERDGVLEKRPDIIFDDEAHVRMIMERIVERTGRRIDESNPIEDASLKDGSRFNGTLYPIAPDGSTFNIRRFQNKTISADEYVQNGTCTENELAFIATCVAARCSILISGGTGSGKTTLLNILSSYIPETERIIVIEDTCELLVHNHHPHVVRFEARKNNAEGTGQVTLNDHLRASLRKRPDRIIVGECRGPEAYTMLEAMSTGHEGSLTTIHANDPKSSLVRLATLVMQGDDSLSEKTINAKIANAIDIVIQVQRLSNGKRKIISIEAVGDFVDGVIQRELLFKYDKVNKEHIAMEAQPFDIKQKIIEAGYAYDPNWFFNEGK